MRTEELVQRFSKAARAEARVLNPGSLIDERYRVVGPLGAGGMGEVYEVERVLDGRRLALKVLSRATDPVSLGRFAREANVIASLKHPNVVSVCDVEMLSEGMSYLVMELVPGPSLKQLKERYGDVEWALPILSQLATALSAVHRAGVVHRDVKPANVIVTDAGGILHVTLVDFGASALDRVQGDAATPARGQQRIAQSGETLSLPVNLGSSDAHAPARRSPGESGGLTQTGYLVGTPRYMAPEVASGPQEIGPAVDVFAFGILAYEVLLGRAPFDDEPLRLRLAGRPLPQPPTLRGPGSRLPAHVAQVIERCVLEEPSQRPTADELAAALAR